MCGIIPPRSLGGFELELPDKLARGAVELRYAHRLQIHGIEPSSILVEDDRFGAGARYDSFLFLERQSAVRRPCR